MKAWWNGGGGGVTKGHLLFIITMDGNADQ